jgi:hypothetical protein
MKELSGKELSALAHPELVRKTLGPTPDPLNQGPGDSHTFRFEKPYNNGPRREL